MAASGDDVSDSKFGKALVISAKLPGVRIDRAAFLRRSLARHCYPEQIEKAIAMSPAEAGVSSDVLRKLSDDSILHETSKTTALAAAAGVPGGFAMFGTVPADAAQNLAHMLRVAQKLAYIYGWPELFSKDGEEPDDGTQNVLTLFIGVMFGVQAANRGVSIVASKIADQALRKLPKQALTKGVVYPLVKTVATKLGFEMTKGIFAKGVAKAIPVAGAVLSGGLTLATFLPMARRLRKHLESSPVTPAPRIEPEN